MKRFACLILAILMMLSMCACIQIEQSDEPEEKTPIDVLSTNELCLFEALQNMSNSFLSPADVRLLEIGDFQLYDGYSFDDNSNTGHDYFLGVKVRLQGTNAMGGAQNQYFVLRLFAMEGKNAATALAEANFEDRYNFWYEYWGNCASNEYPKSSYDSFEEYRKHLIQETLTTEFYHDVESATAAATTEFDNSNYYRESWDNCLYNEYPKSSYTTFQDYRQSVIDYKVKNSFIVKDYDQDIGYVRDSQLGIYYALEEASVGVSVEDRFNITKINKALKYYWDEKLGNI